MPFYMGNSKIYLIIFGIASLWEVLLLSGITYGWASIVVVFKENGFFLDLCPSNSNASAHAPRNKDSLNHSVVQMGSYYANPNDTGCKDQNERLNLIFTIAVVFLCCVKFPVGIFLDSFGPRLTRALGCIVYVISCFGLAFAEPGYGNLLFPVFILMCGGGSLNVLSLYQVCNVVFGDAKSLILCILHGAFDSSAVVLLLFKLAYDGGILLRDISLFYAGLCALTVVLSTTFLIPSREKLLSWNTSPKKGAEDIEDTLERSSKQRFLSNSLQCETFVHSGSQENRTHDLIVYKPSHGDKLSWKQSSFVKYGAAETNANILNDDKEPIWTDGSSSTEHTPKDEFGIPSSIWECVFSPAYLLELLYLSFVQLKLWFFVGSLNQYLELITNDDFPVVSYYVDVFGYVQLCGVIVTPFIGAVFDKSIFFGKDSTLIRSPVAERIVKMRSAVLPIVITAALCLLFCALSLIKSLSVMIPCFVLYTVVRGFMYSTHGAYIGIAFPSEYFGRLYGLGVFTAGLFGLLQYALFVTTTNYLGGDPYWMNVLVQILALGTLALPVYVFLYCNRAIKSGVLNVVEEGEDQKSEEQ